MNDVERGLALLANVAAQFVDCVLSAMKLWHEEHSVASRVRLSSWTRDNYLYDQTVAMIESSVTKTPLRVREFGRMKLISLLNGDLSVNVWPKKIHSRTLLTSNYPTESAIRRQEDWSLFESQRSVLFVFGHTIFENLAGSDAWIDRIIFTQEARDSDGTRHVTLQRQVYQSRVGSIPLTVPDRQLPLFGDVGIVGDANATAATPTVRVKPRKPNKMADISKMPKVGTDEARRAAEEIERQRANKRVDGAQGA